MFSLSSLRYLLLLPLLSSTTAFATTLPPDTHQATKPPTASSLPGRICASVHQHPYLTTILAAVAAIVGGAVYWITHPKYTVHADLNAMKELINNGEYNLLEDKTVTLENLDDMSLYQLMEKIDTKLTETQLLNKCPFIIYDSNDATNDSYIMEKNNIAYKFNAKNIRLSTIVKDKKIPLDIPSNTYTLNLSFKDKKES